MNIGIYKITNLINNHKYIGSSKNIRKRKLNHFGSLLLNKHHNKYLQRAYNKYGLDNFVFEVIEYCEIDQLLIKEKYYMELYKAEYNLNPILDYTPVNYKSPSEETKNQISKKVKEIWKKKSDTEKEDFFAKMRAGHKKYIENKPGIRKTYKRKRLKCNEIQDPECLCQTCKKNYKQFSHFKQCKSCNNKYSSIKGRVKTPEEIEKIKTAVQGKSAVSRKVMANYKIYKNMTSACKEEKVTDNTICNKILNMEPGYKISKHTAKNHRIYPNECYFD